MANNISITEDLAQKILDYLVSRPYAETYTIIAELQAQAAASAPQPLAKSNENFTKGHETTEEAKDHEE